MRAINKGWIKPDWFISATDLVRELREEASIEKTPDAKITLLDIARRLEKLK